MDTEDRVLCHACGRVWPRSSTDSLDCPHCGSEFTEIIEIPPDTDPEPEPSHPNPPEAVPGHRSPPPRPVNPWADHDPWARMDDDDVHEWDAPGYHYTQRSFRSPGGNLRFSFQAHTLPPRGVPATQREMGLDPMHGLDSFFQSITQVNRERAARAQGPRSPGQPPGQPPGPPPRYPPGHPFDDMYGPGNRTAYHQPPFGLFPRDADGPQPMNTPLRSLTDILELFHTNLGNAQAGGPGGPNVRVMNGGTPLGALLSAIINIERNGDAVYSQEELDRVITQLVEQNGNRSAAPPASQDAINALPKKSADAEMVGSEGGSECSICMDTVKVGDEVTVLPCTHWFHPQCIEMWLNQHNTCPHCRRGIDPTSAAPDATTTAP
ncbi:hypothetical protein BDW62DRAFT_199271 [Aspergillus aurantiobrunneus]